MSNSDHTPSTPEERLEEWMALRSKLLEQTRQARHEASEQVIHGIAAVYQQVKKHKPALLSDSDVNMLQSHKRLCEILNTDYALSQITATKLCAELGSDDLFLSLRLSPLDNKNKFTTNNPPSDDELKTWTKEAQAYAASVAKLTAETTARGNTSVLLQDFAAGDPTAANVMEELDNQLAGAAHHKALQEQLHAAEAEKILLDKQYRALENQKAPRALDDLPSTGTAGSVSKEHLKKMSKTLAYTNQLTECAARKAAVEADIARLGKELLILSAAAQPPAQKEKEKHYLSVVIAEYVATKRFTEAKTELAQLEHDKEHRLTAQTLKIGSKKRLKEIAENELPFDKRINVLQKELPQLEQQCKAAREEKAAVMLQRKPRSMTGLLHSARRLAQAEEAPSPSTPKSKPS